MRIVTLGLAASAASLLLAGCNSTGLDRDRPDEFAVARSRPLVVPPDFALVPPAAGTPTPQATDARSQAIEALFGGPAPRSASERQILNQTEADRAAQGARSIVGDPNTTVVDKGATTTAIIAAPEGDGAEARTSTPQ